MDMRAPPDCDSNTSQSRHGPPARHSVHRRPPAECAGPDGGAHVVPHRFPTSIGYPFHRGARSFSDPPTNPAPTNSTERAVTPLPERQTVMDSLSGRARTRQPARSVRFGDDRKLSPSAELIQSSLVQFSPAPAGCWRRARTIAPVMRVDG